MAEKIDDTPMTREHVARTLNVSLSSVDRLRKRGVLESSGRIGNVAIIDAESVSEVKKYLKMREWFLGNVAGLPSSPMAGAVDPHASR